MTSRERVQAALQHRDVDRTPVFEYVLLPPLADDILGRPLVPGAMESGWEASVRQEASNRLDLATALGHDMMYVTPNAPRPVAASQSSSGSADVPEDPVERLRMRNNRGDPSGPGDDTLLIYACLKEQMARRGVDLPIFAPAWAHGVWTDVDLMQTMILDPPTAHEHFALATRRSLQLVEKYVQLGIDMIGVGGDFAGNRPIISPEAYRTFIVPEVRTVCDAVHAAGRYAVNASDGNLWPVIDDFLIGCGVDGYAEVDMHAGMDLRRLKDAYGDRVTFFGNLDCGNTLSFGSPDEVRRHVIDCIEAGWGSGGHILCASNAITASVPAVNYLAAVNAYREHFGLPRLPTLTAHAAGD